jgi:hypothetical protein
LDLQDLHDHEDLLDLEDLEVPLDLDLDGVVEDPDLEVLVVLDLDEFVLGFQPQTSSLMTLGSIFLD